MIDPPVKSPDSPIPSAPIALRPATFGRFDAAVKYVEGLIRTRAPRPGTERFPGLRPGAWGLLAPGDGITAASGLTLGTGTVTLCTQDGEHLTNTTVEVTAYNSGPEITSSGYAGGDVIRLAWTEGGWAVNCWGTGTSGYS